MSNLASSGPRAGDRLADRYDLLEEIGSGGMGRVFRAHDRLLARDVAIKVLTHAGSGDVDFQRACMHEARTAARLVHPGIATVFDTGVQDGYNFLVMELVLGKTVREMVAERGRLQPTEAVAIAAKVAEALEYAHRHAVLHCDVKPHNIIVTPAGLPKLVDFGIARAANATGTLHTGQIYGSVPYLAPEQVRGEHLDARVDVYALAIVLYEMLTGRPPFQGQNVAAVLAQRLTVDPPPPRSLNPAVSARLERVVLTALARDPAGRPSSARAFAVALRGAANDGPDTVRLGPVAVGRRRAVRRWGRVPAGRLWERVVDAWPWARRPNRLALGTLVVAAAAVVLGLGLVLTAALGGPSGPTDAATKPAEAATKAGDASKPGPQAARGQPPTLPGVGWAVFTRRACEWSNQTTPPAICFGERAPGFRVRVVQREGRRWTIWDPETRDIAYVDREALRAE